MTPSSAVTSIRLETDLPPKQEHLVSATYRAISDRGSDRTSLQEIADRAGVSKAMILYYFGSKNRLLLETMRWVLSRTGARIRTAIDGVIEPTDRIHALIDEIFSSPEVNRRFYLVYIDLLHHAARDPEFGELNATFRSIVNTLYEEVIVDGTAIGAFTTPNPAAAAEVMRAIIDGLFTQWLQESEWRNSHAGYRERCKQAVIAYLRATTKETI